MKNCGYTLCGKYVAAVVAQLWLKYSAAAADGVGLHVDTTALVSSF